MAVVSVVVSQCAASTNADVVVGVSQFLSDLSQVKFFGIIEIQFQDGNIILVRKQESLKPSQFLL